MDPPDRRIWSAHDNRSPWAALRLTARSADRLEGADGGWLCYSARMTERNRKLPQSTYYLRAARAGIQMLEQQEPMDDRLLFLVAGILACLRAVQHALLHHDCDLSPKHEAAIDEWKKRTPMDGKEISFIKNSRDLILKEGAFPGGAGFRLAEFDPDGRCGPFRNAGKRTISLMAKIAILLPTCAPQPIGAKRNYRQSSPMCRQSTYPATLYRLSDHFVSRDVGGL